jgi:phytoene synthase
MDPDEYCQKKAAPPGSTLYYSLLFVPNDQRRAATALYAFLREVTDVTDECREEGVARVKLQWWRDEVQRMFAGQPRHPVTTALGEATRTYSLPQEQFQEIIDGVEMDLDYTSYATFKELSLYCHRVASMPTLMSAEIYGYDDRQTLKYAHQLGTALQLTRIIYNLRHDGTRGRLYVPVEDLGQYHVTATDVMAGHDTEDSRALVKHLVDRAIQAYGSALAHLPEQDRFRQLGGVITAEIETATLNVIADDGYHVLDRYVSLTPLKKLWIAWRVKHRERRRA